MQKISKIKTVDVLYLKNGSKARPTGEGDCQSALNRIYYYSELVSLLETGNFCKKFVSSVKTWSLVYFACSTICFQFEGHDLSDVSWFTFGKQLLCFAQLWLCEAQQLLVPWKEKGTNHGCAEKTTRNNYFPYLFESFP